MNSGAIALPAPFATAAPVLAAGAWFKNSLCGVKAGLARMSRVVGDLNTPEACVAHEEEAEKLRSWLGHPAVIAHDLHPDFHSSRQAAATAAKLGAIALPVQHHHAHIASVCAEHGHLGPVIGLALDGVGLGTDNTPWGGELLLVDGARFERLGHLAPLALPGGDRAAREPWRMAAAVLHDLGRGDEVLQRYAGEPAAATVMAMLEKGVNCPRTSSAGRLFDAASGLLGLCLKMELDAEAAIKLEQAATRRIESGGWPQALVDGWRLDDGVLDLHPLLGEIAGQRDTQEGAALFHATLVAALAEWTARACAAAGIEAVALGGGCFFNRLLAVGVRRELENLDLRVLAPINLVPGDAGLALGQAWVALHHLEN
ncbi:MAG: carbamoyltransferase HypF [Sulfuritalea sp.]|nr:carbamoyltransferase HypF [Sulfuritalea sp.]